ncbi:hypothetical protein DY252_09285 [Thalassospira indica]|uniref:Uncharacterized protein n=1 Tax=Thalassospira indica TaxID=1891279 RepID=A0ABM6XXG2_9PROT|nr:hypothetical protein DY252_09285 [Thalassospira indica]
MLVFLCSCRKFDISVKQRESVCLFAELFDGKVYSLMPVHAKVGVLRFQWELAPKNLLIVFFKNYNSNHVNLLWLIV